MLGWLRRIFGGGTAEPAAAPAPAPAAVMPASAPAAPVAAAPAAPVIAPAPAPVVAAYIPNLPNAAALAAQALSANSRPLPAAEPPPAPPSAPAPAMPALRLEERLVLLQVARGTPRRARPAVTAALQEMIGDRPNLAWVPPRGQVRQALRRLGRDPARAAALLEKVEALEGRARRR